MLKLTLERYQEWQELNRKIQRQLEAAVEAGFPRRGRSRAGNHRASPAVLLTITGSAYAPDKHRGIVELYVTDPRFLAYYDKNVPGCARFLRDAVMHWAEG
ncbi:MAG: TipAS antibiotic-recognition domain-containing protein [Dysosmobacter sp.]